MIAVYICVGLVAVVLLLTYICYREALYVPRRKPEDDLCRIPDTEQYLPYAEHIRELFRKTCEIPYEEVSVVSFDGLKLYGKCYFQGDGAPWVILFHGYKSKGEFDFCRGLQYCLEKGFNAILIDERAHGKSEGRCLTFGIKERRDCQSWVNYVIKRAGDDAKIMLYGLSMGASTVLMATGLDLPENVIGAVADCGYNSPEKIIKKVIRDIKLPAAPVYALIRLGGMIFGGVDLNETDATKELEKCRIPVLFIHGEDDRFVPCEMGRENFEHCRNGEKRMLTVPKAGHGASYLVDHEAYMNAIDEFIKVILK